MWVIHTKCAQHDSAPLSPYSLVHQSRSVRGEDLLVRTLLKGGVQALELDARISGGKAPVNRGHLLIAILLPTLHLLTQLIHRGNVVFQPLPRQPTQFNLRDIE